ncbi:hypothetical protein Rs2_09873 [Raphanus sativus]|nr:hypothetical protein Rs2_09873 [Raphanus sativus]
MSRPRVLRSLLFINKDSVGFITKEKLKKMMKSTGKNPKVEFWEVLIDVDIDGNGGIYIRSSTTIPTSSELTKHSQIIRCTGGGDGERSAKEGPRSRSRIVVEETEPEINDTQAG